MAEKSKVQKVLDTVSDFVNNVDVNISSSKDSGQCVSFNFGEESDSSHGNISITNSKEGKDFTFKLKTTPKSKDEKQEMSTLPPAVI